MIPLAFIVAYYVYKALYEVGAQGAAKGKPAAQRAAARVAGGYKTRTDPWRTDSDVRKRAAVKTADTALTGIGLLARGGYHSVRHGVPWTARTARDGWRQGRERVEHLRDHPDEAPAYSRRLFEREAERRQARQAREAETHDARHGEAADAELGDRVRTALDEEAGTAPWTPDDPEQVIADRVAAAEARRAGADATAGPPAVPARHGSDDDWPGPDGWPHTGGQAGPPQQGGAAQADRDGGDSPLAGAQPASPASDRVRIFSPDGWVEVPADSAEARAANADQDNWARSIAEDAPITAAREGADHAEDLLAALDVALAADTTEPGLERPPAAAVSVADGDGWLHFGAVTPEPPAAGDGTGNAARDAAATPPGAHDGATPTSNGADMTNPISGAVPEITSLETAVQTYNTFAAAAAQITFVTDVYLHAAGAAGLTGADISDAQELVAAAGLLQAAVRAERERIVHKHGAIAQAIAAAGGAAAYSDYYDGADGRPAALPHPAAIR